MEWIKCSEKMPEIGSVVNIYTRHHEVEYDFEYLGEGEFYDNLNDNTREVDASPLDITCNVTHWMPAIESPKT